MDETTLVLDKDRCEVCFGRIRRQGVSLQDAPGTKAYGRGMPSPRCNTCLQSRNKPIEGLDPDAEDVQTALKFVERLRGREDMQWFRKAVLGL